jgi:hypothetical protein
MSLSVEEREFFKRFGYLIKPGFLDAQRVATVAREVDEYSHSEPKFDGRNVWKYDALCDLIVDDATLTVVDDLTGGDGFTFHHLHAARHDAGMPSIGWHHDYEQVPQTNRAHVQVHVLHYLNGLDGTVGDLLLLPKSHRAVMRRDAFWFLGTETLPGMVLVDDIPPGTVIFAHSALLHARRAKPGGAGRTRYFIDIAFMQRGVRWPSYGREGWRDTLARLNGKVHQPNRPCLFDADAFFDIADGVARMNGLTGSLAMLLPERAESERPVSGHIPIVQ